MGQSGPPSPTWAAPPRRPSVATSPTLVVDGFEEPLDWLLELARAGKVDLTRLSILALVEAFADALEAGLHRTPDAPVPDLTQWAAWTVMAAHLAELRSRLLRPADTPEARTAQAEAEALHRQWVAAPRGDGGGRGLVGAAAPARARRLRPRAAGRWEVRASHRCR